ncbi:MAG: histidine kinase [Bacteroidetes bacterium QH_2_63_10]|nr:MAG: histidine kinase [Bacteroidetes bacterium QH_2_63_10]
MTRRLVTITALLLLAGARVAVGQSGGQDERGIPFPSEHYAPPAYQQAPQNWSVVQDDRGLIYVANNNGVLQYDGARWRLIPTTTGTFVRSLAADSLVFVGAKGDFGYLRPDSLGVLRYTSLYERIPEDERNFEDVWGTHVLDDGVYYQASKRLFRWDGTEITTWTSEAGFHTSFAVDGTLYVRDSQRGLLRLEGDSLNPAPGLETIPKTPIYMMARHPSGNLLIGTQKRGLLLYDGNTFRPFASELDSYLRENKLYHGCRLPGNRYALATLGGGVVVIDSRGEVVRVLDGSSGLPDSVVNYVYTDREGQLWMALNSGGVFRADLNAPLTLHDGRTGLEGAVRDIFRPNDMTYVATGSGLYVLREDENQVLGERSAHFERWGDLPLVWDMLSKKGDLLVATQEKGVFQIEGRNKEQIADWLFTYDLLSPEESQIVYAGTRTGLKGLRPTQDGWTSFSVEGGQGEIRSLAPGEAGTLWLSTTGGDVARIVLSNDGRRVTAMTRYGERDGLPEGYKGVEVINERVTVFSKRGFFQIENPDQAPGVWQFFRRSSLLPDVKGADTLAVKSFQEEGGRLWVILDDRVFVGRLGEGGVSDWETVDPLHFPKSEDTRLFISRDSTLWLSDRRRLLRYALGRKVYTERRAVDLSALVRQVTTLRRGQVVYGGHTSSLTDDSSLAIPYGRDLRVDVAAPLYSTEKPHQYRYKLAGRNDQWTDWKTKASQRYRNLWEGTYHFRVQARNDRGRTSKVASLTLHIRPPWYRSMWAYLFYGVSFVVMAYGYRRYYQIKEERRRARERVRELERERVVAERLKKANERLREANRLKEDFLATTSHELRTPLTNILGSLEVLRGTATDDQEKFLDMIEENGQRLKRTLNALLDLSMLRSGEKELDQTPVPIDECARQVASELRADAEQEGLSFRIDTPDTPVYAEVDEQYLKQIVRNLVENAIKYTDEGHVAVSSGRTNGHVFVEVKDTGIGISEDFVPELFDEFKQESRGRARTYEGNGLGLAISADLAERMDGSISVETEKDEGSTFTVEFPRSSEVASSELDEV